MHAYDESILPLLHRMLYLEELELDLRMDRKKGLVDANDLKNNIINSMTRLKKFTFNIRSFSQYSPNIHLLSNEDMQSIFKSYGDSQIVSWCDHFPEKNSSYCHAHSYAYRWTAYENISNHFPGGLFKCVADVSLYDERPFEHEFFLQIGRSFPFMKKLTVHNSKPQKNRSHTEKNNCSIIKYPHLVTLDLNEIHNDYIEQFLLDTKMSLPDNVHLIADYRSLEEVTNNFTRDETRANCAKVHFTWRIDKRRNEYRNFQLPQHFKDYFPHADIEIHLNKTHQYLTNLYNHIDA